MEISPELSQRKENLNTELSQAIVKETRYAQLNHLLSNTLMMLGLACSVAAAAIGFFTSTSSKIVGGLAIIPPLIAFVAINLKLERKASWQYRKRDSLGALRSRLLYQQSETPSADDIALIAKCWDELNQKMQAEWDRDLSFNFTELQKHLPSERR